MYLSNINNWTSNALFVQKGEMPNVKSPVNIAITSFLLAKQFKPRSYENLLFFAKLPHDGKNLNLSFILIDFVLFFLFNMKFLSLNPLLW